jgi:hypothetical protein
MMSPLPLVLSTGGVRTRHLSVELTVLENTQDGERGGERDANWGRYWYRLLSLFRCEIAVIIWVGPATSPSLYQVRYVVEATSKKECRYRALFRSG